jgi:hypothetical protein
MTIIYIAAEKLAEILEIDIGKLEEIEKHFDAVPDDQWELREGTDYRIINKSSGKREYTLTGAYAIAEYVEWQRDLRRGLLKRLLRKLFVLIKGDIRKAFVKQQILNNCGSLVRRNDRFFVSERDAVSIFKTRRDYLNKMFEKARGSDRPNAVLIQDEDYTNTIDEYQRYYSLRGIYKLSIQFSGNLSVKNRCDWCKDVGSEVKPQVDYAVSEILARDQRVDRAKSQAKKHARHTCQVTREKRGRYTKSSNCFVAHHLYSYSAFPHLGESQDNLIVMMSDIHQQFHVEYMGGWDKTVTLIDFENFVRQYYPGNIEILNDLQRRKLVLGDPQPVDLRNPHVLQLPPSRVS